MNTLKGAAVEELAKYDAVFVTGGSSGIGAAFLRGALEHSRARVFNISRSAPAGLSAARSFVHIPCDLSDASALDSLSARIRVEIAALGTAKPPRVLLVNNAGFGLYGEFPSPDAARNMEMIRLNISAPTRLCAEFLPAIKAGGGSIINVSSLAAFEPCPVLGVYAATKAYVKSFSLSLSYELGKHGCKCLCVCPGPTSSNFFKAAGFDDPPLAGGYGHEPAEVAAASYSALAKGRAIVVVGFWNSAIALLARIVPARLLLEISGRCWNASAVRAARERQLECCIPAPFVIFIMPLLC